jgi:UDP-N-acetyl-D-mannosaminuronate dehydrogenase
VTYKPDIADQRESPAKPLAQQLIAKGAEVIYHDPHVTDWRVGGASVERADDLDAELAKADVSVLLQNHSSYDLDAIAASARLLFDTRGKVHADGVARL